MEIVGAPSLRASVRIRWGNPYKALSLSLTPVSSSSWWLLIHFNTTCITFCGMICVSWWSSWTWSPGGEGPGLWFPARISGPVSSRCSKHVWTLSWQQLHPCSFSSRCYWEDSYLDFTFLLHPLFLLYVPSTKCDSRGHRDMGMTKHNLGPVWKHTEPTAVPGRTDSQKLYFSVFSTGWESK